MFVPIQNAYKILGYSNVSNLYRAIRKGKYKTKKITRKIIISTIAVQIPKNKQNKQKTKPKEKV